MWSFTFILFICLHGVVVIHRGNFIVYNNPFYFSVTTFKSHSEIIMIVVWSLKDVKERIGFCYIIQWLRSSQSFVFINAFYMCFKNVWFLFSICLDVEFPERSKLRFMDKVPQMPGNIRPPKMTKSLKFMRGPEEVHNFLLHQQFGIVVSIIIFFKLSH